MILNLSLACKNLEGIFERQVIHTSSNESPETFANLTCHILEDIEKILLKEYFLILFFLKMNPFLFFFWTLSQMYISA